MLALSAGQLAALVPSAGAPAVEVARDLYVLRPFGAAVCAEILTAAAASAAWRAAEINADLEVDRAVRDAEVLQEFKHPQLLARLRDQLFGATRTLAARLAPRTVLAELQIVRYGAGGTYIEHRDSPSLGATPRALALVWYLNDDFSGGATAFLDGDVTLQPLTGVVVTFAPTLLHRAEPVTAGTKYVVTAWYHVPPARKRS
jgi:predicted 2-oxoglutarate/Fe(II)-dependent dioxygenase YbiX